MDTRKRGRAVVYLRRSSSVQSPDLAEQHAWATAEAGRLSSGNSRSVLQVVERCQPDQNPPNDTPVNRAGA
jgi:hypothetical protein